MKICRLLTVLALIFSGSVQAGEVVANNFVNLRQEDTQIYGDFQIDKNGHIEILNGKTLEQAAPTFWPAVRQKSPALSENIRAGRWRVRLVGIYFVAIKTTVRMDLTKRRVSWDGQTPTQEDRDKWDAICLAYSPTE